MRLEEFLVIVGVLVNGIYKMRTPGSTSPAPPVKRHVLEVRETKVEGAGLANVEGVEGERYLFRCYLLGGEK